MWFLQDERNPKIGELIRIDDVCVEKSDLETRIKYLEAALQSNPPSSEITGIIAGLCVYYTLTFKPQKLMELFAWFMEFLGVDSYKEIRLGKVKPDLKVIILTSLGIIYSRTNKMEDAAEVYEHIFEEVSELDLKTYPYFDEIASNYACVLHMLNNPIRAEYYYREALAFNPKNIIALTGLSQILIWEEREIEKAESYLKLCGSINPDCLGYPVAMTALCLHKGNVWNSREMYLKAQEYAEKAVELYPDIAQTHINLGCVFIGLEDYGKAISYILKGISLEPRNKTAYDGFKSIFKKASLDEIIENIEANFRQNPDIEAGFILADLLDYVGDEGSVEIYRKIMDLLKYDFKFGDDLEQLNANSLKPVYTFKRSPVSNNTIIIKGIPEGKEQWVNDMKEQCIVDLFLYRTILENRDKIKEHFGSFLTEKFYGNLLVVAQPIKFFQHSDGNFFYITKKAGDKNLEQILDRETSNKERFDIIDNSLKSLAILQDFATKELEETDYIIKTQEGELKIEKFDYSGKFMERAINGRPDDRFDRIWARHFQPQSVKYDYSNKYLNLFIKEFEKLLKDLKKADRFFVHGDYLLKNILEGGIIIDTERKTLATPVLDAASILDDLEFKIENEKYKSNFLGVLDILKNPSKRKTEYESRTEGIYEKGEFYRNKLINNYIDYLIEFSRLKMDRKKLIKLYEKARIFNTVCNIGTMLARGENKEAVKYLDKVLWLMEEYGYKKMARALGQYLIEEQQEFQKRLAA